MVTSVTIEPRGTAEGEYVGIRREQSEQTQSAILDAAADEFARNGYAAVTFQVISDRTGVSRGGVFYYFENKDVLARRILELEAGRWDGLFASATSGGERGLAALAACAHVIVATLHGSVRARAALRIIEDIDSDGPNAFQQWEDAIRLCLQQAIADREVSDTIRLAEVSAALVECIYGVCLIPGVAGQDADPAGRLNRALALLLPGLRSL